MKNRIGIEGGFRFQARNNMSKSSGVHHGDSVWRALQGCCETPTTVTRRDQADGLRSAFTAALPSVLKGTMYTNGFSNS